MRPILAILTLTTGIICSATAVCAQDEWDDWRDARENYREWLQDRREASREAAQERRESIREWEQRQAELRRESRQRAREDLRDRREVLRDRGLTYRRAPADGYSVYDDWTGRYYYYRPSQDRRSWRPDYRSGSGDYRYAPRYGSRYEEYRAYEYPPSVPPDRYRYETYYRGSYPQYERYYRPYGGYGGYPNRESRVGASIGTRIGEAIAGPDGAAIGAELGAEIGAEVGRD